MEKIQLEQIEQRSAIAGQAIVWDEALGWRPATISGGGGGAPLDSPAFTGTPTAPTATVGTNTTQIATTAFVATAIGGIDFSTYAPKASPTFTGIPAAPTATAGTNTTQIATTAFVTGGLALKANLASPAFTGTPTVPTVSDSYDSSTKIANTKFVIDAIRWVSALEFTYAGLDSPAFTGTPTAPTAATDTNNTQLATTAFVKNVVATIPSGPAGQGVPTGGTSGQVLAKNSATNYDTKWIDPPAGGGGGAPLDSPAFTGTPTAPTPAYSDYSTRIATTEHIKEWWTNSGYPSTYDSISSSTVSQIDNELYYKRPRALNVFCGGKPLADEIIGASLVPYISSTAPFTLHAGSCKAVAMNAATSPTVFEIKRNNTQIGTITFSAGGTVGVFAFSSTSITTNNHITIHAPVTPDATLSDITILLTSDVS